MLRPGLVSDFFRGQLLAVSVGMPMQPLPPHLFPGETPALLVDLRPFTINPDLSGAAGRATRSLGSDRRHQWYTPDFDWYSVLTTGYKRPNMPENGTKHADQNVIKYSFKPALYQA